MTVTGRTLVEAGSQSRDWPFRNLVKLGHDTKCPTAGTIWPTWLKDDGYPKDGVLSDSIGRQVDFPVGYTGHYVMRWRGTGAVFVARGSPGFTVHSGAGFVTGGTGSNMDTAGTAGRIEFSSPGAAFETLTVYWTGTRTFTGFGHFYICKLADETACEAAEDGDLSQMFNQDYVDQTTDLNPFIVRLLNFMGVNQQWSTNVSKYSSFPAVHAVGYGGERFHNGDWVGNITGISSSTVNYTCGPSTNTTALTHGSVFQGKWGAANTGACTLVFNGAGAKSVVTPFTAPLASGEVIANTLHTFVYDSIVDKILMWEPGYPDPIGFHSCWPMEVIAAFANKLNKHVWITIPPLMNSTQAALMWGGLSTLNSDLIPYAEIANELWNGQYAHTSLYTQRGVAMGIPTGDNRASNAAHGRQVCEVMPAIKAVMARTKGVIAGWAAYPPEAPWWTYLFNGDDLASFGFNVSPNRPRDKVECIALAPYPQARHMPKNDGEYTTTHLSAGFLAACDQYATGVPASMETALDWMDTDYRTGGEYTLDVIFGWITNWTSVRVTPYGKELVNYEGAFESVAPNTTRVAALLGSDPAPKYGMTLSSGSYGSITDPGKIYLLHLAYKRNWRFKKLVWDYFEGMRTRGPTVTIGAWLLPTGQENNAWSLREGAGFSASIAGDLYSNKFQSYEGMKAFNNNKRIWKID